MKKTILSARGLCKSFAHNGEQIHVITDANLDIYEGDFTVIMGASGSGRCRRRDGDRGRVPHRTLYQRQVI